MIIALLICGKIYHYSSSECAVYLGIMLICFSLFRIGLDLVCRVFKNRTQISRIDKMSGIEFEEFLRKWFKKKGYKVEMTKTSNDYGADLLLYKKKELTVVQAKCYGSNIGIKAVQEVIGAMSYYDAQKGMVVTNQYFTKNAINLAQKKEIELLDRDTFTM